MTTPISPHGANFHSPPPPQNRRLAEFATFLGDYKVAMTVWDSLRKDGKGGAVGGHLLYLLVTLNDSNLLSPDINRQFSLFSWRPHPPSLAMQRKPYKVY